jgi:hypothetical protein
VLYSLYVLALHKPSLSFAALRAAISTLRGGGTALSHFLDLGFAAALHTFASFDVTTGASAHHGVNITATARCRATFVIGFAAFFLLSCEHAHNTKPAMASDITDVKASSPTSTNKPASQPSG